MTTIGSKKFFLENCIQHSIVYIENDDWDISNHTIRTVLTKWVEAAKKIKKKQKIDALKFLQDQFPDIEKWQLETILEAERDYLAYIGIYQNFSMMGYYERQYGKSIYDKVDENGKLIEKKGDEVEKKDMPITAKRTI